MSKISASLTLCCKRPRVGTLNHRSVGDRIAVGNAQFTEAAAAGDQAAEQVGGKLQVGIAGRDERHQGLALGGAEIAEESVECGHGGEGRGMKDEG